MGVNMLGVFFVTGRHPLQVVAERRGCNVGHHVINVDGSDVAEARIGHCGCLLCVRIRVPFEMP